MPACSLLHKEHKPLLDNNNSVVEKWECIH